MRAAFASASPPTCSLTPEKSAPSFLPSSALTPSGVVAVTPEESLSASLSADAICAWGFGAMRARSLASRSPAEPPVPPASPRRLLLGMLRKDGADFGDSDGAERLMALL